ncbi:DEAD/DEAH box helicase [Streptomyces sp. E11-3]|uniref:DEAD/DEAH box helicase n=1 Tax=Streptomyces sp. E11-3 TaxID=3110112 RepID=UPI00398156F7
MGPQDEPVPVGKRARAVLQQADALRQAAQAVCEDHRGALDAVRRAVAGLEEELVRAELVTMPLARLREVTRGQLREGAVEALERAGYGSVGRVREAEPYDLRAVPGIGAQSAGQAQAAAEQLARATAEAVAVRIDVDAKDSPQHRDLVLALNRLLLAGPAIADAVAVAERTAQALEPHIEGARATRSRWQLLLAGKEGRAKARSELRALFDALAGAEADDVRLTIDQAATDLLRGPERPDRAWLDFEVRAAEYYTLLARVVDRPQDRASTEGFIPRTLAEEVRAQPLDESLLNVSLRGYQAFGARFALARRRVLIGDEMGLGKTIQAIAALAHLSAAEDATHHVVVCPVGVLINWIREIESRSELSAHRAHGQDRRAAFAAWVERGGALVTTFDLLRTLKIPARLPLGLLVVDEAHYIKNPDTLRAKSVLTLMRRKVPCRVLFVTGTPMQNHVDEFRSLVRYLSPEVARTMRHEYATADSRVFRSAVAPCYLRRNQPDVLAELPGVIHADEWEEFSDSDRAAYRRAVAEGNFMAMRRAAYTEPTGSAKLNRLRELVTEAAENNLKVVVFSTFLEVLATAHKALDSAGPGPRSVVGLLSGELPADRRQSLVDEFTRTPGHAVLLAQIRTGGTGLNLQAASVVVLCEPQLTPALESQAVGRAHRMGQVRRVQVHRLLATDSLDQRLLEVLKRKQDDFDVYARRSEVAESVAEAVDISEASLARRIVEDEQLRLSLTAGPPATE